MARQHMAQQLTCVHVAGAVTLFSRFVPAVVKQCSVKAWISLKPIPNSAKKTGIHPAHQFVLPALDAGLLPEPGRQRWAWRQCSLTDTSSSSFWKWNYVGGQGKEPGLGSYKDARRGGVLGQGRWLAQARGSHTQGLHRPRTRIVTTLQPAQICLTVAGLLPPATLLSRWLASLDEVAKYPMPLADGSRPVTAVAHLCC